MTTYTFRIEQYQYTQATAEYALITLTLIATESNDSPSLFDVGCTFQLSEFNRPLTLFQQDPRQCSLQLLTSCSSAPETSPKDLHVTFTHQHNDTQITEFVSTKNVLFLGEDDAIATVFYLARLRRQLSTREQGETFALLATDNAFPFQIKPALLMAPQLPAEAIGCSALLEDWKIGNRLASPLGLPGCYEGTLNELFNAWISAEMQYPERLTWQVIACAPSHQKELAESCQAIEWINFHTV